MTACGQSFDKERVTCIYCDHYSTCSYPDDEIEDHDD